MAPWLQPRLPAVVPRSYDRIVVPSDTANIQMDQGIVDTADTFGKWVDMEMCRDLNMSERGDGARRIAAPESGRRQIVLALMTSSIMSSAPTPVVEALGALTSTAGFVIHRIGGGDVWIIGLRVDAVRNGAYHFLEEDCGLGYLGPDEAWRVVSSPKEESLVTTTRVREPRIDMLNVVGDSGVGVSPGFPWQANAASNWFRFNQQLQMPAAFTATGASDGEQEFVQKHQCKLRETREMLSWDPVTGTRGHSETGAFPTVCYAPGYGTNLTKLCLSHHGAGGALPTPPAGPAPWSGVSAVVAGCTAGVTACSETPQDPLTDADTYAWPDGIWTYGGLALLRSNAAWKTLCQYAQAYGATHPQARAVSASPEDGPDHCQCTRCLTRLLTAYGMSGNSTPSDRVFHGANYVATFVTHMSSNAPEWNPYVGLYAYTSHSLVPQIPLHPKLWVVVTGGEHTWATKYAIQDAWPAKRASNTWSGSPAPFKLGFRAAWADSRGTLDKPGLGVEEVRDMACELFAQGYSTLNVYTSYSTAVFGPHQYVLAKLAWLSPTLTYAELRQKCIEIEAKWWDLAFGKATRIRDLWSRWAYGFEWAPDHVGFAAQEMIAAQSEITPRTNNPNEWEKLRQRFDHVRCYVHFLGLCVLKENAQIAYSTDSTNSAKRTAFANAVDALVKWCWDVSRCNIIQSENIERFFLGILPTVAETLTVRNKWLRTAYPGGGFATVAEPTRAQLDTLMTSDLAAFPQISGVTRREFSKNLVRVASNASTTFVAGVMHRGTTPHMYRIHKPAGPVTFRVRHHSQLTAGDPPGDPFSVWFIDVATGAVAEHKIIPAATIGQQLNTDWTSTIPAGQYDVLITFDQGVRITDTTRWDPPLCVASVWTRSHVSRADSTTRLYFKVPAGVTRIACSVQIDWPNRDSSPLVLRRPDGTPVTTTRVEPYRYYADTAGMDDSIWSFAVPYGKENTSNVFFENCPNLFAVHPDQLMIPVELL